MKSKTVMSEEFIGFIIICIFTAVATYAVKHGTDEYVMESEKCLSEMMATKEYQNLSIQEQVDFIASFCKSSHSDDIHRELQKERMMKEKW